MSGLCRPFGESDQAGAELTPGKRSLQVTERPGDDRHHAAGTLRRLEPAPAGERALLVRSRSLQVAPCVHVPTRLQEVPDGKAVVQKTKVRESGGRQDTGKALTRIAPVMARLLVCFAEPARIGRDTQGEPAARRDMRAPVEERGNVVFEMLEHLERADQIELPSL